jgi:DNA-binding NarL/FixJ family response regulator
MKAVSAVPTLAQASAGVEVVGAAADGEQAVALATELRPDAVLMDLRMPRVDGVGAARRLRERDPRVKVIALTTYDHERSVVEALRAGARGYLTKDAGAEEIRQALEAVVRGEAAIDPAVQHHLVDALATAAPATTDPPRRPDATRGRGAVADRRRALQRRHGRPSGGQRGHRHDLAPAGVLTARSRPVRR